MRSRVLPDHDRDTLWAQLSELIAENMGLYFPPERLTDLQRGLAGAADEFGFADAETCADWLMSGSLTRPQLQVLASHLTIGETYFFRDKKTFDALEHDVLRNLIQGRRGREQRLRLWSAGCCSGEEAYSLAILLHQVLPDLADWHVTILATDINAGFIRKAVAGSYGEWSFRDSPAGFKERYFRRTPDGRYAILPNIQKLVTFEHLNLVADVYPSLATNTNAMDVIFCRNVLMYFTPAQTRKVVGMLHQSLIDGGWLIVSPSEASHALFPEFVARNRPGVILYQKGAADLRDNHAPTPPVAHAAIPAPRTTTAERPPPSPPEAGSLRARALANEGRLADAIACCDQWIAADKVSTAGHYLRGVVLLEHGQPDEARRSLERALYLDPGFVLAHFALGNLARSRGKQNEADKHFANTLHLLGRLQPDDLVPESDGLTAGRLLETITAMVAPGTPR